jgi:hypothetical protein
VIESPKASTPSLEPPAGARATLGSRLCTRQCYCRHRGAMRFHVAVAG